VQHTQLDPIDITFSGDRDKLTFVDGLHCVGFINLIGVVASVRGRRLVLSIGPNLVLSD
jgi:hypothetical protein